MRNIKTKIIIGIVTLIVIIAGAFLIYNYIIKDDSCGCSHTEEVCNCEENCECEHCKNNDV